MKAHKRLFLPGYQHAHKHWQRHLEAVFSHSLHLLVRLTYRKGDECLPRLLGCSSLDLDSICRRQDNNFSCDFAAPPPRPSHHGGSPVCLAGTLLLMPTPYLTFYLSYSPCGCHLFQNPDLYGFSVFWLRSSAKFRSAQPLLRMTC